MALLDRQRFTSVVQTVWLRALEFPRRSRSLLKAPLGRAILWIGLSLFLAAWAHHSSTRHAIEHWEDSRRPSAEVWGGVLLTLGYRSVEPSPVSDKTLKQIPERFRNSKQIWRSQTWFVLSSNDGEHLWTRKGFEQKPEFLPLDNTWESLASVSKEQPLPPAATSSRLAASPQDLRDPREIRY